MSNYREPSSEISVNFSAPPHQPFSPPRPLPHLLPFAVGPPGSTAGSHTEFTRDVILSLVPPLYTEFTRSTMARWDPSATSRPLFVIRPFRPSNPFFRSPFDRFANQVVNRIAYLHHDALRSDRLRV